MPKCGVIKFKTITFHDDSHEHHHVLLNCARRTLVSPLLHTLKHDGYEAAHESLLKWTSPLQGPKRAADKRLLTYTTKRREMINDPVFLANGWQIFWSTPAAAKT